jgi:glycosyltransferase involved in cell wall biosynthesis
VGTKNVAEKKLKIAIFVCKLSGGGAERAMVNLTRGLLDKGVDVDLVLGQTGGEYVGNIDSRANVVELNYTRTLLGIPALIKYLRNEQPTAIISAADYTNVAITIAKILSGVKTKVLICEQNAPSYFRGSYTLDRQLMRKLTPLTIRLFYRLADEVISVSKGVAVDLAEVANLPLDRVKVVHNPIVTPDILQKSTEDIRHPWFIPNASPVILGIGRLSLQKDFITLIQAFKVVQKDRPVRLMILGEGEQRATLESLIKELGLEDSVTLPGFVDNPFAYLRKSAVFVLSSESEGLPSVLIEALSVGTPVVSTDCPCGPSEILENGRYGSLVPVGDINALAQSIISTLDNPCDSRILLQRAQQYSLETVTEQYLSLALG